MYSGITSGRVLNGELLYTKILEVDLFAFAYRLFRRDFSPLDGTYFSLDFLIIGKSVHPDSKLGRSRLSLLTSKVFMAFDLYSSNVIRSSGITHQRW